MTCEKCTTKRGMAFECIACCVRWLSTMSKEALILNAPVIESVMGKEHMDKVRQAWSERNAK